MTRIDFYLLSKPQPGARQKLACRIAEKAFGLGHRVHIHTASKKEAMRLDDLLWTFRDGSFVPHETDPAQLSPRAVTIGHDWEPEGEYEVLINLDSEVPLFFSRFERVAEILDQDPQTRQKGRERYRFYRDRGYDLNTHEIDAA